MSAHAWLAHLRRGVPAAFGIGLFNTGVMFLAAALLARWLGVHDYGHYVFVTSNLALLGTLATSGHAQLLQRQIAALAQPAKAPVQAAWRQALRQALAATVLLLGLAWLVLQLLPHAPVPFSPALLLAVLALPVISGLTTLAQSVQLGLHRVLPAQLPALVLQPLLFVLLLVALHFLAADSASAALALCAYASAGGIAMVVALHQLRRHLRGLSDASATAVDAVATATGGGVLWLALNQLIVNANTQIDVLMLGWLGSPAEVGLYHVANRGAYLTTFLFAALNLLLKPMIATLHGAGELAKLAMVLRRAAFACFLVTALGSALIALLSDLYLGLFGPAFHAARLPLLILLAGWLYAVLMGPGQSLLMMCGKEKTASLLLIAACLINVALNLLLIPRLGAAGAALATTVSIMLLTTGFALAGYRQLGISSLFLLPSRLSKGPVP